MAGFFDPRPVKRKLPLSFCISEGYLKKLTCMHLFEADPLNQLSFICCDVKSVFIYLFFFKECVTTILELTLSNQLFLYAGNQDMCTL